MNRAFVFSTMVAVLLGTGAGCSSSTMVGVGGATGTRGSFTPGKIVEPDDAIGDRVFFTTNSYHIAADGRATLDLWVAWLKRYPTAFITIEGHCDERGSREYNMALGERRAMTVRNYLVDRGVAAERMKTISYGKERPTAVGHDEDTWRQNRRAVAVLTRYEGRDIKATRGR